MDRKTIQKILVSQPSEESGKRLKLFMQTVEQKYNLVFSDYWDFHKWTVDNTAEFWAEIWDYGNLIYSKSYDKVIDLSIPMEDSPKWFEGARLNLAENLLKFRDDRIAFISAGQDKDVELISFKQLYEETRMYAAALRKFGLQKGDRVACYMSNRVEAVIAMLAVTSIGAIWTSAMPLLGPKAYIDRLQQVTPIILFTIDQFPYRKQIVHLLQNIKEITNGLPSLKKVIIVPSKSESKLKDISDIRNSCFLEEFLRTSYDSDGKLPDLVFEQLSFSHPVFISFTSGTTGLPKTIVHGFGGLLATVRDFWFHWDGEENDITLSMSPAGWITWHIFVNFIFTGSTVLLFEGIPHFVRPTHLWDMVHEFKITKIFIIPSMLDEMQVTNCVPGANHDLSSLKIILCSGGTVKTNNHNFIMKDVKESIRFLEVYGCTELFGCGLTANDTSPDYRGEISAVLGASIVCLDDKGHQLLGEMGEIAITQPMPYLPLKLWGDTNHEQLKKRYFSKFPGKFLVGDLIIINPVTKGITIHGRSDTALKQDFLFGSSEIYNAVNIFPEIRDCICVAQYSKDLDQRAVLFVQMQEGQPFNEDLVQRLRNFIAEELSISHVPKVILETPEIPYNVTGKKAEMTVKKIINNMPYVLDSVINAECLKFYYGIPDLQGY